MDTDIESSTMLWECDAAVMSSALVLHDQVLRTQLKLHQGVELMTEGDAFLVAFHSPMEAIRWCAGVQTALLDVEWPAELSAFSADAVADVDGYAGTRIFSGLRVRMGAHSTEEGAGCDFVSQLPNTELLKVTRQISDVAAGGQVLLSNAMYAMVQDMLSDFDVAAVGCLDTFTPIDGEELEANGSMTPSMVHLISHPSLDPNSAHPAHTGTGTAEGVARAPAHIYADVCEGCRTDSPTLWEYHVHLHPLLPAEGSAETQR